MDAPGDERAADGDLERARERDGIDALLQCPFGDRVADQPLQLGAAGARLDERVAPEVGIDEVLLQPGEVVRESVGGDAHPRHAVAIGVERRDGRGRGGAQFCEHGGGRAGEAFGQRQEQGAFGAEALHQRPGRQPGALGDVGEGQLCRPEALHHLQGGGEHVLIAGFPRSRAHTEAWIEGEEGTARAAGPLDITKFTFRMHPCNCMGV
jgi:hypothetical protein